jgi:glycosyltransferase involved in cell wall biosynthesis
MKVTLLVITDGRASCLEQTLNSFDEQIEGGELITDRIIVDDSCDANYGRWIDRTFAFRRHLSFMTKVGFAGAIDAGWREICSRNPEPQQFVFHLEDDFVFERRLNLPDMIEVLNQNNYLVQMALRRQPWNEAERHAGGVVEQWPHAYTDTFDDKGRHWLEHRLYFTTNPCLYSVRTAFYRWPQQPGSEGIFAGQILNIYSGARSGLWGRRADGPWVRHIGHERVGIGY